VSLLAVDLDGNLIGRGIGFGHRCASRPGAASGRAARRRAWHPQAVALWADLRRSPLLRDEPTLTWSYLLDTAVLHHRLWAYGEYRHAPELGLRLAKMPATPEDRQRMKVKIAECFPGDGKPSPR